MDIISFLLILGNAVKILVVATVYNTMLGLRKPCVKGMRKTEGFLKPD